MSPDKHLEGGRVLLLQESAQEIRVREVGPAEVLAGEVLPAQAPAPQVGPNPRGRPVSRPVPRFRVEPAFAWG